MDSKPPQGNKSYYTPAQCEEIVKALAAGKMYLWDGFSLESPYTKKNPICMAISRAEQLGRISFRAYDMATNVILARLWPNTYVHQYLEALGIPDGIRTQLNVQTFRHLWVNELIREFSA